MPSTLEKQIHVYGEDNANVKNIPSIDSNSLKIRACKLFDVQRKFNEKFKRK
jgi:hypothetical protein